MSRAPSAAPALLADIGGTNARFRLLADGAVRDLATLRVDQHASVEAAIEAALADRPGVRPSTAVLGVAGPVIDGRMRLTNADWTIDERRIAAHGAFAQVRLINDFAAVAWSIPDLAGDDVEKLGGGAGDAAAPSVVLGPGTGLGAAAYLPNDGGMVVPGEGGHVTLAAANEREDAVLRWLRGRFGHVSVERAVSGPGLENLYQAIAAIDGVAVADRPAEAISGAAMAGDCAVSREALDMFCALLGGFAGDLALTFSARGGIFLGGGILPQIASALPGSALRERLVDKGRFREWLSAIPVWLIHHPEPAFLGLARVAGMTQRPPPGDG